MKDVMLESNVAYTLSYLDTKAEGVTCVGVLCTTHRLGNQGQIKSRLWLNYNC